MEENTKFLCNQIEIKNKINELEKELEFLKKKYNDISLQNNISIQNKLTNDEIAKYSRQLIMPEIGVEGQLKLKSSKILVVGAGGLGCPALQYLVGAGCCEIGIVDYDRVEISNLHRQILHKEFNIGVLKSESAKYELLKLNNQVNIEIYNVVLNSETVKNIIPKYDIVLDCTDNVASRYLLNDASYLAGIPLISGSALKFEGQLTIYNYKSSPCYRCIFPKPPPLNTVANCEDAGVLGAVTGVIGSLQALEAIKIITGCGEVLNGRLLLFDGLTCTFRNVRLRHKRLDCTLCSEKGIIKELIDYNQFCGSKPVGEDNNSEILDMSQRISVQKYKQMCHESKLHLLIDVRSVLEHKICHLNNSLNIPLKEILEDKNLNNIRSMIEKDKIPMVVCLCRRGNDSQIAVKYLTDKLKNYKVVDIIGGLHAWHKHIDSNFPIY